MGELALERHEGAPDEELEATVQELLARTLGSRKPALRRRLAEAPRALVQLARWGGEPAGYKVGLQEKPGQFYSWLGGVLPEHRRRGIGRALLRDQQAWLQEQRFRVVTMKTRNQWRGMLLLAISEGFDVVGVEHRDDDRELMILLRRAVGPRAAPGGEG